MLIDKVVLSGKCTGCHACYSICPHGCITMKPDRGGYLHPCIDRNLCVKCNLCSVVCPANSKTDFTGKEEKTEAWAFQHKDNDVLRDSSSGGAFSAIAEYVLRRSGKVYGAAFDADFRKVRHIGVEKIEDLYKIRGSKYVQSEIGNIFTEIKRSLKEGRYILFTGTPCQVAGLNEFLQCNYENLITVDILCHGVPSPRMWEKYVDYREKIDGENVVNLSFRDKRLGWRKYSVKFQYANGEYVKRATEDAYFKGFLRDVYLRMSCYSCKYKSLNRASDFTIGDFWGIESFQLEKDDKGISLILIHSDKGKKLFEEISKLGWSKPIPEITKIQNGGLNCTAFYNYQRRGLMKHMEKMKFDELRKHYFSDSIKCKIVRWYSRKVCEKRK